MAIFVFNEVFHLYASKNQSGTHKAISEQQAIAASVDCQRLPKGDY